MAEYDLTAKLSRYFDPHLVFPLLEFLSGRNIFDERELVQAKYDLLQKTSMVDFQLDIHRKLHTDRSIPGELTEKRERMLARYEQLSEAVQPLVKAVLTEEAAQLISREHDSTAAFDFLEKEFDIERTMVDDLYTFARHVYDCGEYSRAAINLGLYRALVPNDDKNMISCLWGKLASEILMKNWEEAFRDLNQLKAAIESSSFRSPSSLLHQRTWFIHWSLFVYFNYPQGLDGLIELFLGSPASVYLNTLQTTSPHLLRYLATAVIINRQKRTGRILRELVKIIEQECYAYRDPITEFLRCVYVQIDFDGAQQKLRECADALSNDFFLTNYSDEFVENARLLIFETYCRIHHRISIDLLAEKLNMNSEEAERWILNLVRNTDLDAKLDSEEGVVVMGSRSVQPWQTVIERTKNLFNRTENLVQLSERKKDTNARWQTYQPREPQTTNEMTPLIE